MPNLFQNIGGGIGGVGKWLTHPLVRGMERTESLKLQNQQRLLNQLAQQLELIKQEGIDPATGMPKTATGRAILQNAMKNPLMQQLNQQVGSARSAPMISPTAQTTKQADPFKFLDKAIALEKLRPEEKINEEGISELTAEDKRKSKDIDRMQDMLMMKSGLFGTVRPTAPQTGTIREAARQAAAPRVTWEDIAAPLQRPTNIPSTQEENLANIITERTAPSAATNNLLKKQPLSTRKAVSDATIAGLGQQVASQISANYGTDALEALAGANEAQRKRVLALMQAYQKRGAIDRSTRDKIRKMLGLK